VPAPGYAARAVMVKREIIQTNAVPLRVRVEVPYQAISLAEQITGSGEDQYEIRDGIKAIPAPDHPSLGRVAIVEEYRGTDSPQRITLARLLPDSQPVEGAASFTIGDFGYPVRGVSWRSERRSEDGVTYTRQVPEYALGPAPTHEIVVRTRSLAACSAYWQGRAPNRVRVYDCPPYGRVVNGAWR